MPFRGEPPRDPYRAVVPNGTWLQRHPSRYFWRRGDIRNLIQRLYNIYDGISINSYHDHPEGWSAKLGYDTSRLSMDVWDDAGRGVPINPYTGADVVRYIFNDPNPPWIDWCIWQGRIWTRSRGCWVPFEDDGTGSHHDHPHFTYTNWI